MSAPSKYATHLGNLTRHAPVQLDPVLFAGSTTPGTDIAFVDVGPPVSPALWARPEGELSYIGIRVTAPIEQTHALAADLAALAVERQIIPVFLSRIGQCGMQQFGFRVEMVGGTDEDQRQACEDQLTRLWNLAMIVDAADVSAFS